MISCKIGQYDMYETFGLMLASKNIAPPAPQIKMVDVIGRNGSIDMSEAVTGSVRYNNRDIELTFLYLGNEGNDVITRLYSFLHGRKLPIIFGDDPLFYYIGRIKCTKLKDLKHGEKVTMKIDADPFKYDIEPSSVDWEWDIFDFETGLINELNDLIVDGEISVSLVCRQNAEIPTIICSNAMEMEFDGNRYQLKAGENNLYRVIFLEGYNDIKFIGHGTVSIEYVGGLL